ncbi:Probable starch synthase 4, chloroplastic/amyloplastic [Linum perenne]
MATTKPPSCFINHAFAGFSYASNYRNVRFSPPLHHQLLLSASCKMRHRHLSYRKRRVNKTSTEQPTPESESLSDDDNEKPLSNIVQNPRLNQEIVSFVKATAGIVHQRKEHNVRSEETNSGEELDDRVNGEELESKVEVKHIQDVDPQHLEGDTILEEALSLWGSNACVFICNTSVPDIFLLNDAKFRALEDLDIILSEKQSLQREINGLQTRLAGNDARLKIAAQEKSLSEEMESLRTENMFIKQDLEALKAQFGAVKDTDQRVATLEEERSTVVSSLKDLESRVSTSQEDVSKLSSLRVEYKDLSERVECLQTLLDKATRKADQAILVSQQNQELLNKVDKLEESLEEANIYKLSSEKLQQYNELMQQKIKLLEDHLQRSDEEINSYLQLYQESVQEFQDTLNNLIEESKKRVLDEPVDDMPWELWSCLLLKVDGWLLEKKITIDDAKILRDLVWKRDRKICDAYMECREKDEFDSISTFLKLTSAPKREPYPGLHVIHIAAEMAPVAKALDQVVESYYDGKLYKNKIWVGIVEELASCGLDVQQLNRPDRMQDNSAHDRVNSVKGAVVFSNIVTTVSLTYAQEVRTAEGGKGLHSTLNFHSKKFIGILNGIDGDSWNPSSDSLLSVQYSANDLGGKAENKTAIRRHLGLSNDNVRKPLVGCITRLVPQKGVHLIRHAIYRTLELGGQFVLLGSSPISHIQFRNDENARLILKYDEALSHSIYAASDMFIIPSIFEPCGLTQMIAMRYGSVPIVRKTGGLNDSVFDVDDETIDIQFRNGFSFLNPNEHGFDSALERAFKHYMEDEEGWEELVRKIMNIDFSWEASAAQYEDLYSTSAAKARAATE